MPIRRKSDEDKDAFISRCMSAEAGSFPDEKQRYDVCMVYFSDAQINDATPKTLYVSRKVKNAESVIKWAKSQGFTNTLKPEDLHVTIAYSRKPIDWMKIGEQWSSEIKVAEGGPRVIDEFGGGAKVLQFKCSDLEWRNMSIREAGASWDFADYHPHITISYGDMPENVTPYQGEIILGPEIFQEIDDAWKSKADLQDCNTYDRKSSMTQKFVDSAKIGSVRRTKEGYVTARAKAVRSGVQVYRAKELGDAAIAAGFSDDDMVRVMRPEEEVFLDGSAATFSHVPVTVEHPKELVDAANWKDYAVGEVGSKIMRDGEFLALDLILKDAAAIAAFDSGKRELSAGYTADIEFVDNKDGYDAVMSNIRINHLALVDKGRAGSQARIGDADQWGAAPLTTEKGPEMEMKAVAIGDKAVHVAATDADTLIKMIADKDTAIGELKAKLADAESKILDDDAIAKLVKDRADAMARREAVKAKFGDEAVKDASDAEIMGMFKVIDKAPAADETARAALGDAMKEKMSEDDPWAKVNAKKKGAK